MYNFPSVQDQRGFKNVGAVNRSIRELFIRLSPRRLACFGNTFELVPADYSKCADPIIRVQKIARDIAYHYQIGISAVVVTFRSNLPVPGRVELTNARDFFIELHSQHKNDVRSTVAILAHEIAHIFLHIAGVRFADTFQNEVLTDTAAIFLGCGPAILNAADRTVTTSSSFSSVTTTTRTSHFGYISIDEMGYIQAKRDFLIGSVSGRHVRSGLPSSGYRRGAWAFRMQCRRPPVRAIQKRCGDMEGSENTVSKEFIKVKK